MSTQILPPERTTLPLLPLRDVVVFPHMVIPLFVGRPKSIKALDMAMEAGKHILLVAQKQAALAQEGRRRLQDRAVLIKCGEVAGQIIEVIAQKIWSVFLRHGA
jgi:ATP-dependent Lon protease